MAKNFMLPDAIEAIKAFRADPTNKDTQLIIADMNRRHPIAMAMLQLGMYDELLKVTPNYYTLRKADSASKVFTPKEFRDFLGDDKEAVEESADLDTVDDEKPAAVEKPSKKQAQNPEPIQSYNLDELLEEEIK